MKSLSLFKRAQRYIPSGVNSPVRAFKAVGGNPVFIKRGKGSYIWSEDGKKYLDFCASWGPLIFGHAPAGLLREVQKAIKSGTSFGASTRAEVELAQTIASLIPSIQKVRLVSSGTEAVMSAVRLARGFTGRKKIVKIDGGYHGHADSLLVKAGSGLATFGVPDSAGIPEELSSLTISIPFNDLQALENIFKREGSNIACMILEPVPANMGVVLPVPGYLEKVRAVTKQYGSLLIFDEVITGFRVAGGGAQSFYGIKPDLTCLGKILGGGFPIAAFGGRADIMNRLAPEGPVYQAGTLSGNPVAVAAALWMLKQFKNPHPTLSLDKGEGKEQLGKSLFFPSPGSPKSRRIRPDESASIVADRRGQGEGKILDDLNKTSLEFFTSLQELIWKNSFPVRLNFIASMFTLFFTAEQVTDYRSAKESDTRLYAKFFQECLKGGLYIAPAQFEANFISTVHTPSQLSRALSIFDKSLKKTCLRSTVQDPLK